MSPENTSLSDLIDARILSHLSLIKDIISMAQVEFEEEQTLQDIENELKNLEFKFFLAKDGQTQLLWDPEELSAKLLDHNYQSQIIL